LKQSESKAIGRNNAKVQVATIMPDYKNWSKNGADAAYIVREVHEGRIEPDNEEAFVKNHITWLDRYKERNLKLNFKNTVLPRLGCQQRR
jgi:hypothetical protein